MNIDHLYRAARSGRAEDEKRLFDHLSVRLTLIANLRIGNKEDAMEVVQEALATIAGNYVSLEIESSFRAWVYRVFDNKLLNYISQKQRRARVGPDPLNSGSEVAAAYCPDPELRRRIVDCFTKLRSANIRYGRILNLRYQGFATEGICRRLDITVQNLYMILSRARAMMKRCLETGEVR